MSVNRLLLSLNWWRAMAALPNVVTPYPVWHLAWNTRSWGLLTLHQPRLRQTVQDSRIKVVCGKWLIHDVCLLGESWPPFVCVESFLLHRGIFVCIDFIYVSFGIEWKCFYWRLHFLVVFAVRLVFRSCVSLQRYNYIGNPPTRFDNLPLDLLLPCRSSFVFPSNGFQSSGSMCKLSNRCYRFSAHGGGSVASQIRVFRDFFFTVPFPNSGSL